MSKVTIRHVAAAAGVAVNPGIDASVSLAQAHDFLRGLPSGRAMIIKALAGGGGRGTRVVRAEGRHYGVGAGWTKRSRAPPSTGPGTRTDRVGRTDRNRAAGSRYRLPRRTPRWTRAVAVPRTAPRATT